MGYSDYVRASVRPECWGNRANYDPSDPECDNCRYHHSCNQEINRGGRAVRESPPRYRSNYRPRDNNNEERGGEERESTAISQTKVQPATIESYETPVERFTKDAVGGGLRGMFYEMWQFWRHYRIR